MFFINIQFSNLTRIRKVTGVFRLTVRFVNLQANSFMNVSIKFLMFVFGKIEELLVFHVFGAVLTRGPVLSGEEIL